jgi:hypothetical protein
MTPADAVAVALFVVALICATVIGLWAVGRR